VRGIAIDEVEGILEYLAFLVLHAPDDFEEDYLPRGEQLDLDRAFAQLRLGVDRIASRYENGSELGVLVESSYAAYRAGDDSQGARLLQLLSRGLEAGVRPEK
jgi:hypothetical protein